MTFEMAVGVQRHVPARRHDPTVRGLAPSVARVGAERRLEAELRSIAVDLLGPYELDELPDDCAAWVQTTIESAVAGVCDTSLAALVHGLETCLAIAPSEVARQLDEARDRHDAGLM